MENPFCLIPEKIDDFKKALKFKEIKIEDLIKMSTEERVNVLEKYAGDNAKNVNLLFEQKLVLKNWERGIENWFSKVTESGRYSPEKIAELKKSLESEKIRKHDRVWNPGEDEVILKGTIEKLLDKEFNTGITEIEAKNITELSKTVEKAKSNPVDKNGNNFEYGAAQRAMEKYLDEIKLAADKSSKIPFKELSTVGKGVRAFDNVIFGTLKIMKSIQSSFDNSFSGRQAIGVLMSGRPKLWGKGLYNSFGDIYKTLRGQKEVLDATKAWAYGQKYAMDGTFDRMKLSIGKGEEAFPTHILEKAPEYTKNIPVINKPVALISNMFKASNVAYEAGAIRMRVELANALIEKSVKQGIDITSKKEAESIGKLVNSITGRGTFGRHDNLAEVANVALFSPRFLKANLDVLTAHTFDKNLSTFARKEAAYNLLGIVISTASVMTLANVLHPKSAEIDARSSDLGKIKIGNTRFDITGGKGAIVVLAARLAMKMAKTAGLTDKGSVKNTNTGIVTDLGSGFGETSAVELVSQFFENKAAPPAALVMDLLNGEDRNGDKLTVQGELGGRLLPIPTTNFYKNITKPEPGAANLLLLTILDGLGFSSSTYSATSDWNKFDTQEMKQAKEQVGQEKFDKMNEEFNQTYTKRLKAAQSFPEYKNASEEDKQKAVTKLKDEIKSDIFKKNNVRIKREKPKKVIEL